MRAIISLFLISFTAWTISSHLCVLFHSNLKALILIFPIIFAFLSLLYIKLFNGQPWLTSAGSHFSIPIIYTPVSVNLILLLCATAAPFLLNISWVAFWFLACVLLTIPLFTINKGSPVYSAKLTHPSSGRRAILVITSIALLAIYIAYSFSRSDLDDAFYVAVAAHASVNPEAPLLTSDPMLGGLQKLPLIFSSYRFSSFELLSAATAYIFNIEAMDAYYIYFLPIWVGLFIFAIFLLAKKINSEDWLLIGFFSFLIFLLTGEAHRGPGNFTLLRLYQGKALLSSALIPIIYYFCLRFFSSVGTSRDLFLLFCCQFSAIGLSNFGMLIAPLATLSAVLSTLPSLIKLERNKIFAGLSALFVPIPYAVTVFLENRNLPAVFNTSETPMQTWVSIFGAHQQYIFALLLIIGPLLAKDIVTRWRLAVPSLILFCFYFNPWLAGFIAKFITTPPVFWRVTWSFPIVVFMATSLSLLLRTVISGSAIMRLVLSFSTITLITLIFLSKSFHLLRIENTGAIEHFASWKIPNADLHLSRKVIQFAKKGGVILAPDEISGVISRFNNHPPLMTTRFLYLEMLKPVYGPIAYQQRQILYGFISKPEQQDSSKIKLALKDLDISVIVLPNAFTNTSSANVLSDTGYTAVYNTRLYTVFSRVQS